ncbi:class I SAM-dependent methyltransferase [Gudongella sp. SC589]|jgi:predicted TPR repeat methyltransferase|uniref:class I SAM-dependent methyltransferase n=1 Tax=Gudongella sp. SC589 TaxID=3385990 RepID=UPI0039048C75
MEKTIWDFWAGRYNKLWVQKKSLRPTREYVKDIIKGEWMEGARSLLDLGCGPGELIRSVREELRDMEITGLDFSKGMLQTSRRNNPYVRHLNMEAEDIGDLDEKFDLISCTHSLPYYRNKRGVIKDIAERLNPGGKLIIAFASGDTAYDKVALSLVKLTTGPASYPSDVEFRDMVRGFFLVERRHVIRESFYMPTIAVYTLRRQ